MIKIKRASCPKVLKGSPLKGTRYNKKEVVETLWEMQHKKCCYCEQEVSEEGHSKVVEHFHPQSVYKNRRNDWKNLLLACAQCNGQKSDKFPTELTDNPGEAKVLYQKSNSRGRPLIIDPSDRTIDPEEHIGFVVDDREVELGLPIEKNHSRLGRTTIDAVGLAGSFYNRKRANFCIAILMPAWSNLLRAELQQEPSMLQNARNQFAMLLSAKGEFAAFARSFAKHKSLDTRFKMKIPVGSELAGAALGRINVPQKGCMPSGAILGDTSPKYQFPAAAAALGTE